MNKLDLDYQNLLRDILENGVEKDTRNGKTLSVFGRQIRHDMKLGFPLLTTKKMAWKTIVTELLWFLNGSTNIKYLVDNNCHIWDGDCYANYLKKRTFTNKDNVREPVTLQNGMTGERSRPFTQEEFINKIKTDDEFADKYGDLGPIYGAGWRRWPKYSVSEVTFKSGLYSAWRSEVDQISKVIDQLKTNPDDRGIMVSAWNVSDLDDMVLRPCHYSFQFYTRELSLETRYNIWFNNNYETGMERFFDPNNLPDFDNPYYTPTPRRAISLMFNMRSCDFPLGIPANIMSYALLLMMIAKQVNMVPEELIGNFGDCHIYKDQIEGVKEQLTREPYPLPSVKLSDRVVNDLSEYTYQDIILENYQSHPKIYFPLSN
jgi:thymidylate synthase